jgi:hypothetical protein
MHALMLIWILNWRQVLAVQCIRIAAAFSTNILKTSNGLQREFNQLVIFTAINVLMFELCEALAITVTGAVVFTNVMLWE